MLQCFAVVSCHSCCNDLILPGPFLGLPCIISLMDYHYHGLSYLWALMSLFPLGILGPFVCLGIPWPFLLTLYSHGLFIDFIGLPRPNCFILILGVHGSAINPLFSLFALLWACCDLFLLFFTSHTAHGFATHYFSLFGLFWAHLLSQGPFTYFMDLWSIIPAAWV